MAQQQGTGQGAGAQEHQHPAVNEVTLDRG